MCAYIPSFWNIPAHPTPLHQVITEHRAQLPVLHSRVSLSSVYMSMLLPQLYPDFHPVSPSLLVCSLHCINLSAAVWSLCVCVCVCVHAQWLSHVWFFVAPQVVACQAPLPMKFSRQEYWFGVSFPTPGDLLDPGIEPLSLASPSSACGSFTPSATWEAPVWFLHSG